jgi:glycosyltransferase involved in cell wall biosynthesis
VNKFRICIVSPGHLATNPRLVKEATTLTEAGYSVEVICGRYSSWGVRVDAKLANSRWRACQVPFGRYEMPMALYAMQAARRKLARGAARSGLLMSSILEIAHAPIVPGLIAAALQRGADLYIAHYVAALPAVARAAKKHQALYAFDAEDFHLGDLPDTHGHKFEKSIIHSIEGRYLPNSTYVTAASPLIAEAYAHAYRIQRPIVVLNTFPLNQAPALATSKGSAEPGPSLYWFSQTIGPNRGLECAVRAIGIAESKPHLYLRGQLASEFEASLMNHARAVGAGHRVHILPPAEPERMEHLASAYDIGLVLETGHSKSRQMCLTNKLFSFILAGLPPIMSDTPAHRLFAAEAGLTDLVFPIDDAVALAGLVDQLLLSGDRLEAVRSKVWQLGQERYNWQTEQKQLVEVVQEAIQKVEP